MSDLRKTKMYWIVVVVAVVTVLLLGYFVRGGGKPQKHEPTSAEATSKEKKVKHWTCSMHPQINRPGPGKCPICAMDLIPVYEGVGEEEGPRELTMSETGKRLAEIQTTPVERKFVSAEVRMIGKVDYDETKLGYITAWVGGRIDRLYVDYTGIPVKKGDHMVELYSPELISAQQELLQAIRTVSELRASNVTIIKETAEATIEAAREKLRLWGLAPEQIAEIEQRGEPTDHITIYSPMSGIVIHKNALEGMYVKTGTKIYTIADLNRVWVKLKAYESDMIWLRYGQPVEFETEAYPGETFNGRIAFIDPILNEKTRTVDLRVNVENPDGRLKPGMFIRGKVRARLTENGRVLNEDIAGKWIGPMHPEIIKDEPGLCDICEMPLVSAESLGYVSSEQDRKAPLVIPSSAPLITGKRAVVYVRLPEREKPTFEGREVVLGPRAGDYYIVRSGLEEGELVVTSGAFKIDSSLQIMAKPSMMSPEGGVAPPAHHHGSEMKMEPKKVLKDKKTLSLPDSVKGDLSVLVAEYMKLSSALAGDNYDEAAGTAKRALELLKEIDMTAMDHETHMAFMKDVQALTKNLQLIVAAEDIEGQRRGFAAFSEAMEVMLKQFGPASEQPVYRFKCPMAFGGRGAAWLQASKEVNNPYFGEAMLGCGELVETVSGESAK